MSGGRDLCSGIEECSDAISSMDVTGLNESGDGAVGRVRGSVAMTGWRGIAYQIRSVMFFILKGLFNGSSFAIATDVRDAGKFDDLVFKTRKQSSSGGYIYRLIQVKHKGDKTSNKITSRAIFSNSPRGYFGLMPYFRSYLELKPHFTKGMDEIEDLIIYTNGTFQENDAFGHIKVKEAFEEARDVHDMIRRGYLKFSKEGRKIAADYLKEYFEKGTSSGDIEDDIDSYLEKLRFAVDQYDIDDLEGENRRLIQQLGRFGNHELVYLAFEKKVTDWMRSNDRYYLTSQTARKWITSLVDLRFDFHSPVTNFIGRERELKLMKETLDENKVAVISGLAGIGKSELARKFIQVNSTSYKSILWIDASNPDTIMNSFHRIADKVMIKVRDDSTENLIEEIYSSFGNKDSVFVFDDVQDTYGSASDNHYVKDFLPKYPTRPSIIITSRKHCDWDDMCNITLEDLQDLEAEYYIKSNLPESSHSSEEAIKKLVKKLHSHPLAMQHAVAYIKDVHESSNLFGETYCIGDYLRMLDEEEVSLIQASQSSDIPKEISTTVFIALELFGRVDHYAEKILHLMSYFTPNDIDANNIFVYFDDKIRDKVKSSMRLLVKFSFIESKNNKIRFHRKIQDIILMRLKQRGKDVETLRCILSSVHAIDLKQKISVWTKLKGYVKLQLEYSHIPFEILHSLLQLCRYADGYEFGKQYVSELKEICEPTDANLLKAMERYAKTAFSLMRWEDALAEYEDIMKRIIHDVYENLTAAGTPQRRGEKNHPGNGDGSVKDGLEIGFQNCYLKSGDVIDALDTFVAVFEKPEFAKAKCILEKNLPILSNTVFGYVKCISSSGDRKRTLMLYEGVQKMSRVLFGEDQEYTLLAEHEIAMCHGDSGDKKKALKLLANVYHKEMISLGEDHANTNNTRLELKMIDEHGDGVVLESILIAHQQSMQSVGENHEKTLNIKHELAICLLNLGNVTSALQILEGVHVKQKDLLGENHEGTLCTEHGIAMCHLELGEKKKALNHLENVYDKQKRLLGIQHVKAMDTLLQIAKCHSDLGDKSKALILLEDLDERFTEIFGENNGDTLYVKYQIAVVKWELGNTLGAMTLFSEVRDREIETFGIDDERTLLTQYRIAMCHSVLGDKGKSLTLLEDVYSRQRLALSENHQNTLCTKHQIAVRHAELGDKSIALRIFKEVHERKRIVLGDDHESTITTLNAIAVCHLHLGQDSEALENLENVFRKRSQVLGDVHQSTLATEFALANLYSKLGDKTSSLKLLEDLHEKRSKALGVNHSLTRATLKRLQTVRSTQ